MKETVVVIGASKKEDRYSNKAVRKLLAAGHTVIPVNPVEDTICDLPVAHSAADITSSVDTVTMYVNPAVGKKMEQEIIGLHPKRVIFNPGAESDFLVDRLSAQGIQCLNACTLVLLSTNQF
ncbi:MAG: CoA-binding protein [Spirochaetales bacterium]|nr:CoA-binding protein [Spirochaetales bacterium]